MFSQLLFLLLFAAIQVEMFSKQCKTNQEGKKVIRMMIQYQKYHHQHDAGDSSTSIYWNLVISQ